MAVKKNVEEVAENKAAEEFDIWEKKVTIRIPRGAANEPNYVTCGFNGRDFKIMKGVDVEVPWVIAEILEQSERAEDEAVNFEAALHN